MLLGVGTYIVLHQSLKAGRVLRHLLACKPGAQWNMQGMTIQNWCRYKLIDLPIVLCNFTGDLVVINFHCRTSRIFISSSSHLSIYIYIHTVPPEVVQISDFSHFVVVYHILSMYLEVLHWPRALCKRVWKSYLQRRFSRTIWRRALDKWHVMSHQLRPLKEINCWSFQNLPNQ